VFIGLVRDTMPDADEAEVERAAIACWSALHGFAALRMAGRLARFQAIDEAALLDRILRMTGSV
jgi:hypothetical protein